MVVLQQSERDEALKLLQAHQNGVCTHASFRRGTKPIVLLRPAGSQVLGTILIWHGFTRNASCSSIQATYFYGRGFNVVSLNLAGHHLEPELWPRTVLRDDNAAAATREAIMADQVLNSIVQAVNGSDVFARIPKMEELAGSLMGRLYGVLQGRNLQKFTKLWSVCARGTLVMVFISGSRASMNHMKRKH